MNERTRQHVVETAQMLGYIPNMGAKELVNGKSRLIGLVIPEVGFSSRPPLFEYFPPINYVLKRHKMDVIVTFMDTTTYKHGDLLATFTMRNLEGCIVFPGFGCDHAIYADARSVGKPVVVLSEDTVSDTCSSIGTDEYHGGFLATRYLIEQGHRKIGLVSGPTSVTLSRDRSGGYRDALSAAGIDWDDRLVVHTDFSAAASAEAVQSLVASNTNMTSIFFLSDTMAISGLHTLHELGIRVPQDISVVGYDGSPLGAYMIPPLTTILHGSEVGTLAGETLMHLIQGAKGSTYRLKPQLIVRSSVSQPR